ncbi:allantoate deiminase [Wenjunlia vitaminophila]|uniref:Allantoate deiminase n=1 Tax=Wenjunlia vitaminophila TaxID=76728 RepID=A0A0T6LT09_WENVI|nr:Zn-dependent hydrolase [Wenjunlia vitaminophila]KRV49262.1 allantoate deiminase [Wenjunlia vitaminophila]
MRTEHDERRPTAAPTVPAQRVRDLADQVDARRLAGLIEEFASLSEGDGAGVTRLGYTPMERRAHERFAAHMRDLGLTTWTDAAGNTHALRPGRLSERRGALGTGSHLDSVPEAGRFDGIAGVVAAMEVARVLADNDAAHDHPLRFVAFAAEEGARFGQACTGSRIAAGLTRATDLDGFRDAAGTTLADAMRQVGLAPEGVDAARWDPAEWNAFVELHIEQGNVLESLGLPVGIVDEISGSSRLRLSLTGRASHTGGTPMRDRADALTAAAECVLLAEELATDSRHHGTRITVGKLEVRPGSITTIPGQVEMAVDIRDVDSDRQRHTAAEFVARSREVCERRGIALRAQDLADASPVILPVWLADTVAEACTALDVRYHVMTSGASHDSQMINHVVPTGMIFVPSKDGLSHTPAEQTAPEELAAGTRVLLATLLRLDGLLAEPANTTKERAA